MSLEPRPPSSKAECAVIALISGEAFRNFCQNLKGIPDLKMVKNPCLRLLVFTRPLPSTPVHTFLLHTHELTLPGDKR